MKGGVYRMLTIFHEKDLKKQRPFGVPPEKIPSTPQGTPPPLKKRTEHVETNFINHLTIRDFIAIFTLKNNK